MSKPYLDYDLVPFGVRTNFFCEKDTSRLLRQLSTLNLNGKQMRTSSILKSHFPVSLLGEGIPNLPIKIIYIYRDPVDVMISLWRLYHQVDWLEGAKTLSPLDLAKHVPTGQSQRYQKQSFPTYLIRWASHVNDGITASLQFNNVTTVNYKLLLEFHAKTTIKTCQKLDIRLLSDPSCPMRQENIIKGKGLQLDHATHQILSEYCSEEISKFPKVKEALEN